MSISYTVDDVRRCLRAVTVAPHGRAEIVAHMEEQAAAGLWAYGVLDDVRALQNEWLPTTSDVRVIIHSLANLTRAHGPRGKVAFLVRSDQAAIFGVLRMYASLAEVSGVGMFGVFHDEGRAIAWLSEPSNTEPS